MLPFYFYFYFTFFVLFRSAEIITLLWRRLRDVEDLAGRKRGIAGAPSPMTA